MIDDSLPPAPIGCPAIGLTDGPSVTLAHGEGGRLTRQLISGRILPALGGASRSCLHDAAQLAPIDGRLAVTTDSFVVTPLFFPGGDIGSLAVYGTVNDLVVSGARPLYLTVSLILEEGLPLETLDRVLHSVAAAAAATGVQIVAGDTKVVPRGAADGLFINTTGVGQLIDPTPPGPAALREDDQLIVSGPIGRHGIAILCAREELAFEPPPRSDSAPLTRVAEALRSALGSQLRALRDATRGGVAAVLHEWAEASGLTLTLDAHAIPVSPPVRGACELLGLDPLHVANEGTLVAAVASSAVPAAMEALRAVELSAGAAHIGAARPRRFCPVTIRRPLGSEQPLDDPPGAPLPRIC